METDGFLKKCRKRRGHDIINVQTRTILYILWLHRSKLLLTLFFLCFFGEERCDCFGPPASFHSQFVLLLFGSCFRCQRAALPLFLARIVLAMISLTALSHEHKQSKQASDDFPIHITAAALTKGIDWR